MNNIRVDSSQLLAGTNGLNPPRSRLSNYSFMSAVLPPVIGSATTSSNPLNVMIRRFSSRVNGPSAQTISNKLLKLVRIHKKLSLQEHEVIRELNMWSNTIPEKESRKLIIDFLNCLQQGLENTDRAIQAEEALKKKFSEVYIREKKSADTKLEKERTREQLKVTRGNKPQQETLLLQEKLEEQSAQQNIVDEQFVRSINGELSDTLGQYLATLHNNCMEIRKFADDFLEAHPSEKFKKGQITLENGNIRMTQSQPSFSIQSEPAIFSMPMVPSQHYNVYSSPLQSRASTKDEIPLPDFKEKKAKHHQIIVPGQENIISTSGNIIAKNLEPIPFSQEELPVGFQGRPTSLDMSHEWQ
ncbi:hypothetical protein DASC09_002520 [Saccharomycopsis crataegensis]|uniref:Uncharacterized protein n=1 Tax=Saccharomycopsis crataegensis TaxID=43959 RepID=A0AAV5QE69_9ASCO|nr:hypothetical protein DASC09_002520 [Saccharomycopsis crataegensis]